MKTILVYICVVVMNCEKTMYVCLCHGISDKKIMKLAQEHNIVDIRGIREITPLGSQCGKCIRPAKMIIEQTLVASYKKAS